jgi:hypothetical protein
MRTREFFIVMAIVAVVVTLLNREPAVEGTSKKTEETTSEQTASAEKESPIWTVNGISLSDSDKDIESKLGEPVSDDLQSDTRSTLWKEPDGTQIRRTIFLEEQTLGIMGTVLGRDGETVVSLGTTVSEMRTRLGEPTRVTQGDDHMAYQYEGARIYIRDDAAFGVVIEGSLFSDAKGR